MRVFTVYLFCLIFPSLRAIVVKYFEKNWSIELQLWLRILFSDLVETVLLSCVAGAIRSYLQKHKYQDPDDILVCIRTDIRPQHTKLNLDNKSSLAFVKLPVGTEGMILLVIQWLV